MPRGRPSKLTPEIVEQARELAARGLAKTQIAVALKVSTNTVDRWLAEGKNADPDSLQALFSIAIYDGWIATGSKFLNHLQRHAENGSTSAATWFLTHHPFFRDEFSDAAADRRVERQTIAAVIEAIAAAGLTPEQERAVLLQIDARGLAGSQRSSADDDDTADDSQIAAATDA